VAEAELRDLRALCATLRASEATPEVVPLRPEVAARALRLAHCTRSACRGEARLLALRVVGKAMADRLASLLREQTASCAVGVSSRCPTSCAWCLNCSAPRR
jgi:hypothetical protein